MKLLYNFFLISIIVINCFVNVSCNGKARTEKEQKKNNYNLRDTLFSNQENVLINEFRAYVDSLDSTDVASAFRATEKFKSIFTGKSKGLCDSAFVVFLNLTDTLIVKLNDSLDNDTTDYQAFVNDEISTPKVLQFRNTLLKNGFTLKSSEGIVYIDLSYDYVIRNFSAYVSDPMNVYLSEIQTENKEGFAQDAAIVIAPEKHVDRIIWYENFIKQNPNFVLIENCRNYRKAYFTYLLSGFDNTPLFSDNDTRALSLYFKIAFDYLLKKYPDSETAMLTQPYYETLKQKEFDASHALLKKYQIKGLIFNLK